MKSNVDNYPSAWFTKPTAFAAEGARVGIASCKECGAAILLDPRDDVDKLQIHREWHLYTTALRENWVRLSEYEQLEADNERLAADCKARDRLIETQRQYLDNKDSVIKGMNKMITKLEGDLEVMRLQRDAKRWTKTPTDVNK